MLTHAIDTKASPAARPLGLLRENAIDALFQSALSGADGITGAHCIHERWMRGDMSANIDRALEQLWRQAADSIPDWLPMRHIQWLPLAYEVSARFRANAGRSNIYLVLLDYSDRGAEPYGVYVGMSHCVSISTRRASAPRAACSSADWRCSPARRCICRTSDVLRQHESRSS